METLARNGATFRTKLMSHAQALQFAKCLAANPKFGTVSVSFSERAKGDRSFFVAFLPVDDASSQRILDRQQAKREATAAAQIDNYEFVLDDSAQFFWCLNAASGQVYEVTDHSCDCPDHTYRCQAAGIVCKHITMLRTHLQMLGDTQATDERFAQALRDRNTLWD